MPEPPALQFSNEAVTRVGFPHQGVELHGRAVGLRGHTCRQGTPRDTVGGGSANV